MLILCTELSLMQSIYVSPPLQCVVSVSVYEPREQRCLRHRERNEERDDRYGGSGMVRTTDLREGGAWREQSSMNKRKRGRSETGPW